MASQTKKGYLRGCRGILITELNADGSMPASPTKLWVDTAQEASIEAEVVEGETSDLRGGDHLLVQVTENDVTVGVNVDFTDAKFDAALLEMILGGSLVLDGAEIIGWEAPLVADQTAAIPFQAELYVQSFNSEGGREAYLKYKFPYCVGRMNGIEHSDQDWGTPEFSLKARENPSTGAASYRREFVTGLPPSITLVKAGGTFTLATSPTGIVSAGSTVTVLIDNLENGGAFTSIAVEDAAGTPVSTTTVTLGEEYTFVMPATDATVTVTITVT